MDAKRSICTPGIFALLLLLFPVIGCDNQADRGEAHLQLLLTDAPLDDVLQAHVTILRAELVDSTGRQILLLDEPLSVDLLTLRDGVTIALADALVPVTGYEQLRLVVGDSAYVLLTDSSMQRLKIPSGETTGIKVIDFPPDVLREEGEQVIFTLDFDAEASFLRAGNSGKYIFKPVIRPLVVEVNGASRALTDVAPN